MDEKRHVLTASTCLSCYHAVATVQCHGNVCTCTSQTTTVLFISKEQKSVQPMCRVKPNDRDVIDSLGRPYRVRQQDESPPEQHHVRYEVAVEYFEAWCPVCQNWETVIDCRDYVLCDWCGSAFNSYTGEHEAWCPVCHKWTTWIDECDCVVCDWCDTEFNVQQCPACQAWGSTVGDYESVVCWNCDTEFNCYTCEQETDDRDEDGSWRFEDWDDDFIERWMYMEFMSRICQAMDEEWEFERELHHFMDGVGVRYSYCGRKMLWNNVNRLRKQERSKKEKKNGATAARRGHHNGSRRTPSRKQCQDRKKNMKAAKTRKMTARRKNQKQQASMKY